MRSLSIYCFAINVFYIFKLVDCKISKKLFPCFCGEIDCFKMGEDFYFAFSTLFYFLDYLC